MDLITNTIKSFIHATSQIQTRLRFVASTLIVSACMVLATFFFFDRAIFFVPLLVVLVVAATYFSILHGIEKSEWLMLFLMPVLFTVSIYLFYLLFPVRWLTRLPFLAIFSFSFYAILLTSNIFNVGVEKSLQLYRAAFSVNYFYQTLVMFLSASVIFSFRLNPFINGAAMFVIALLLALQLFWSVRLRLFLDSQIIHYSILMGVIMMQVTIILSLLPLKLSIIALFITATYYALCGLLYHHLEQKLFTQTVREYLIVITFVAGIVLLSLQW
jgi:hypothetical protein